MIEQKMLEVLSTNSYIIYVTMDYVYFFKNWFKVTYLVFYKTKLSEKVLFQIYLNLTISMKIRYSFLEQNFNEFTDD